VVAGSWLLVMATASLLGFLEVVRSMELVGEVRVVRLVMVGHQTRGDEPCGDSKGELCGEGEPCGWDGDSGCN